MTTSSIRRDTSHDDIPDPLAWRDKKRYLWLLGLIPSTAIFIAIALVAGTNALAAHFDNPILNVLRALTPVLFWVGPLWSTSCCRS